MTPKKKKPRPIQELVTLGIDPEEVLSWLVHASLTGTFPGPLKQTRPHLATGAAEGSLNPVDVYRTGLRVVWKDGG